MHIVWDWNGTLLADIEAVVAAANDQLVAHGAAPLALEAYRQEFCRPVRAFNERLIGRTLTDAEWVALDAAFHRHYWGSVERMPLAGGARAALERVEALGWTQSLLSMAPHHHVAEIVARRGLGDLLARVDGNHGEVGAAKEANLREHLRVQHLDPADVWLVGDAVDDAVAARAVGARIVLVAEFSCHGPDVLAATGEPVVRTLAEALDAVVAATRG